MTDKGPSRFAFETAMHLRFHGTAVDDAVAMFEHSAR